MEWGRKEKVPEGTGLLRTGGGAAGLFVLAMGDISVGDVSMLMASAQPEGDGGMEYFLQKGILPSPEDGLGAEGCWMGLE